MKLEHHSPSSLNLFAASPAMWCLEKLLGERQPVGVPAHRGTAVEHGVAAALAEGIDLDAATKAACAKYDALTALTADARRDDTRAGIKFVNNADEVTQRLAKLLKGD